MRRTRTLELVAALGTVALVGAACGDDDAVSPGQTDEPTPPVTDTASPAPVDSPTATESPTATGSPTATEAPTPTATATDGEVDGTAQTFIVAPQEPREVSVGSEAEFSVGGTYDESSIPDRLWLGVVPCENYDIDGQAFTSTEDGTADGFDEDFGPRVYDVNGERYENVDDVWPTEVHVQDDVLTFSLLSSEEACGIPVVFDDTDDDGELDVDDQGTPVEPYGIGQATWS